MDGRSHVDESCIGSEKMTSAAGIGNSKGKGNWGGTCHCNDSAREIRSRN
jgi:hypothetical protein